MAKTNVFGFVYFLDSISDEEMFERLSEDHFCAVLSPVHDRDVYARADCLKVARHKAQAFDGVRFVYADSYECTASELSDHKAVPNMCYWTRSGALSRPGSDMLPEWERYSWCLLPQVGQLKKAHRHGMVKLDYSTTADTLVNKFKFERSNIAYFEPINSRNGYLRYLVHLDNPEKAQYNRNDVIAFGGFDKSPLYVRDEGEKIGDFDTIATFCNQYDEEHDLTFYGLVEHFRKHGRNDLAYSIKTSSTFWASYVKGANYERKIRQLKKSCKDLEEYEGVVNVETGEVV